MATEIEKGCPQYVELYGVRYPIKVNENGEHYYNVGIFVYRLPWLDK